MKTLTYKNLFLILILGVQVSSCSDNLLTQKSNTQSQNETSFGSRIPIPAPNVINKQTDIAICNATSMNFLIAKSMVFYDTASQPRYNAIRVWIPTINEAFADPSYHINFYKWKANFQGNVFFDSTNLQIRMERKSDKANASGYMGSLTWSAMKDALAVNHIDVSNMASIFNTFSFTVLLDPPQSTTTAIPYTQDPAVDYDVLKIALYKDSILIEQKDFLLPAFYAQPLAFSDGKPSILTKLHPYYDQISSSWPGTHFAELLNANCF
jgi:hypothetical protein